jgi:hypothetical protein
MNCDVCGKELVINVQNFGVASKYKSNTEKYLGKLDLPYNIDKPNQNNNFYLYNKYFE